jgi:hypothetical protein
MISLRLLVLAVGISVCALPSCCASDLARCSSEQLVMTVDACLTALTELQDKGDWDKVLELLLSSSSAVRELRAREGQGAGVNASGVEPITQRWNYCAAQASHALLVARIEAAFARGNYTEGSELWIGLLSLEEDLKAKGLVLAFKAEHLFFTHIALHKEFLGTDLARSV